MKTAIITPLRAELFILCEALENFGLKKREFHLEAIEIVEFQEIDLLLALGGHGKTQFGYNRNTSLIDCHRLRFSFVQEQQEHCVAQYKLVT